MAKDTTQTGDPLPLGSEERTPPLPLGIAHPLDTWDPPPVRRPDQLIALSKPFPAALIHPPPKGKFGDYVGHSTVTERLLHEVGPFDYRITEIIRQGDKIVGCIGELTVTIDGRVTVVQEAGSEEHPDNQNDGENLKRAASDALKRCAMRIGVGLHLWSGSEYYLDRQLRKEWPDATNE